jgi:hypothetical protein
MPIDKDEARATLRKLFSAITAHALAGAPPPIRAGELEASCNILFESRSQSFREALLGCALARWQDDTVDIRHPYVDQGPNAISLRSFDEQVINPFLKEENIPSSKGPYLAMFRRGWEFTREYKAKVKDRAAQNAFLECIDRLETSCAKEDVEAFLAYLLFRFWQLREGASVTLSQVKRLSLIQYEKLISGLLTIPSGGRFPLLLVLATFEALKDFYNTDWEIIAQGINVADAASGASGDITIRSAKEILMAVEVTERVVDHVRLVSTVKSKIGPAGIADYLFVTRSAAPEPDAQRFAEQLFAQGHEINFLEIKNWIVTTLATMGSKGRAAFNRHMLAQLAKTDVPTAIKVAWNEQLACIIA